MGKTLLTSAITAMIAVSASALTVDGLTINDSGETPLWELLGMTAAEMQLVDLLDTETFSGNYQVEVLEIIAGNTQGLGYYTDLGTGNSRTIVDDTVSAGDVLDFGPSSDFGFFLHTRPSGGDNYWFSEASLNPTGVNGGHMMLVFQDASNPARLIMAWEDLPASSSDIDYNDFVAVLEVVPPTPPTPNPSVPEPASLALLGLGVSGLALRRRLRG